MYIQLAKESIEYRVVSSNGRTTPTDNDRQFNKQYLLKKYGN